MFQSEIFNLKSQQERKF